MHKIVGVVAVVAAADTRGVAVGVAVEDERVHADVDIESATLAVCTRVGVGAVRVGCAHTADAAASTGVAGLSHPTPRREGFVGAAPAGAHSRDTGVTRAGDAVVAVDVRVAEQARQDVRSPTSPILRGIDTRCVHTDVLGQDIEGERVSLGHGAVERHLQFGRGIKRPICPGVGAASGRGAAAAEGEEYHAENEGETRVNHGSSPTTLTAQQAARTRQRAPVEERVVELLVVVFGADCATNPCWSPSSSPRPFRSRSRSIRWRSQRSARMRDALPAFVRHLRADRHAPRTVKTYGAILASFAASRRSLDVPSRAEVEVFLARPRRDGKPRASTTRNQELAALRSFAVFARRELGWRTDPTEGIEFVVEPPHDPDVLTEEELRQLFETAAQISRRGERTRNLALLAVLSQVGLRIHEAVGLNIDQVDLAGATLLGVRGKGDTIHSLPLNVPAVALLGALIAEREGCDERESPLFVSQRGARLSIRAAESLVARLRAGMGSSKKITPHTLRHTAATLTLVAGTDLSTVAELLRHRNVNTTRRYLHLVDTRRREAVRRLEGTVPTTVLPAANSTTPSVPKPAMTSLPKPQESPVFRRPIDLDDQQGLVAA